MHLRFALFAAAAAITHAAPAADGLPGLYFSHHDWELVCDNTRTCRAAGYQSDAAETLPVSLLLTRKAGARQQVSGELAFGVPEDEAAYQKLPAVLKIAMRVNGRSVGDVEVRKEALSAALSPAQLAAVLAVLSRNSEIELQFGALRWRLSDRGAAAVLLKMDEFQGRLGTPAALIRKGTRSEAQVLPALPAPVVVAAAVPKPQAADEQWLRDRAEVLLKSLRSRLKDGACSELVEQESNTPAAELLSASRLSDSKMLLSAPCWRAAYNSGDGYWVVDMKPPYRTVMVTDAGVDYGDGVISAAHKGRGVGDCWSSDSWTWDGKQFVHTESASTGMCKLFAGGAWSLPRLITEVRRPKP